MTGYADVTEKAKPRNTGGNEGSKGSLQSDQIGSIFVSFACSRKPSELASVKGKRDSARPPFDFAQGKLGRALPIRVIRVIRG